MKHFGLILGLCIALITSCEEPTIPVEPSLEVTPFTEEFAYTGGTITMDVNATVAWRLLDCDEALTISPKKGKSGLTTLKVIIAENAAAERILTAIVAAEIDNTQCDTLRLAQAGIPAIAFDQSERIVPIEGETFSLALLTNQSWRLTSSSDIITITPMEGEGNTELSISVPENDGGNRSFILTAEVPTLPELTASFRINQVGEAPRIALEETDFTVATEYEEQFTLQVLSNTAWEVISLDEGLTVTPSAGNRDATLSVSVDRNIDAPRTMQLIVATTADATLTATATFTQDDFYFNPVLEYQGITYTAVRLRDNRLWMAENLRYVPEGITPSDDPTLEAGMWYPCVCEQGDDYLQPRTDAEEVAQFGYLYNAMTLYGIEEMQPEFLENQSLEEARGICPEGWHIPTQEEAENMLNRYLNSNQITHIDTLQNAGFNFHRTGFRMKNNTLSTGSYAMVSQFFTSTQHNYSVNAETGAITSYCKVIMATITSTNYKLMIANGSNFGGSAVRCIKNQIE